MTYVETAARKCRDPSTLVILHNLLKAPKNIPKIEEKFINFLKNSQKVYDLHFGKLIWNTIYKEYESDPDKLEMPKEIERPPKEKKEKEQNQVENRPKKEGEMTNEEVGLPLFFRIFYKFSKDFLRLL